jgi:hypothetical protein
MVERGRKLRDEFIPDDAESYLFPPPSTSPFHTFSEEDKLAWRLARTHEAYVAHFLEKHESFLAENMVNPAKQRGDLNAAIRRFELACPQEARDLKEILDPRRDEPQGTTINADKAVFYLGLPEKSDLPAPPPIPDDLLITPESEAVN